MTPWKWRVRKLASDEYVWKPDRRFVAVCPCHRTNEYFAHTLQDAYWYAANRYGRSCFS